MSEPTAQTELQRWRNLREECLQAIRATTLYKSYAIGGKTLTHSDLPQLQDWLKQINQEIAELAPPKPRRRFFPVKVAFE